MRLLKCYAQNFGSYRSLEIDFSNSGLTLIQGKTGAGKSTIMDVACWALFGETARGGNVDEVRSWTNPDEPTQVTLEVETQSGTITVNRIRGTTRDNDLSYSDSGSELLQVRGKDLQDTQKLLNKRLGLDADSYVAASYFHEFSRTGTFFTAKAKDRRDTFERIAPLELPAQLSGKCTDARRSIKAELSAAQSQYDRMDGRAQQLNSQLVLDRTSEGAWEEKQKAYIEHVRKKAESFEADKSRQIQELEAKLQPPGVLEDDLALVQNAINQNKKQVCKECGGPKKSSDYTELLDMRAKLSLQAQENKSNLARLKQLKEQKNAYAEQLESEISKSNPFTSQIERLEADIAATTKQLSDAEASLKALGHRFDSLVQLQDLAASLRGELLKRTVKGIENETNRYLETYFDAEIRVEFSIDPNGDDLDVGIKKSGYDCVYRQLSKGQRCMLRLTFSLAVMAATANKLGIHFDQLFFDESLDGLDADLKVKAFRIFEELETRHGSIFLIEHAPELQALATKRYLVSLEGDVSELRCEEF